MKFDDFVPPHIRALPVYAGGKPRRVAESESGVRCIKMASNENPWGPSPRAVEAMAHAAADSNFYPDNFNDQLRCRLAELHQLTPEQVLVTDGSTSFLDIIAHTLLAPGLNAVTSERSFIVYDHVTAAAGGALRKAPMHDGMHYDLDAVLRSIDAQTRIVWLANPNNPTGAMLTADLLDAFVTRLPAHVLLVLDEAYCDFAEDHAARHGLVYTHSLDYVRAARDVVVLRTFSKAHGLAGLRVGYGFATPRLINYFSRVRTAFSVSGVAEAAALAALADTDHVRKTLASNTREVERLMAFFAELSLHAIPTVTNFICFDVPEEAATVAAGMQQGGVIIRPLTAWGMPRSLRVSVGTPLQNDLFMQCLRRALARPLAAK
jgi:histidinol-phosphate aminotransferase